MSRLWILGAPDPEMTAIEKLLRDAGETFVYANHHRQGDPGHGLPPAEFLRASSIGQVISTLADLGSLDGLWLSAESSATDADPGDVEVGDIVRWGRDDSWAVVTGLPNREPDYPGEHVGFFAADIPKDLTAAADHCLGDLREDKKHE